MGGKPTRLKFNGRTPARKKFTVLKRTKALRYDQSRTGTKKPSRKLCTGIKIQSEDLVLEEKVE